MKNADQPAFSAVIEVYSESKHEWVDKKYPGLTKREYFAAMAMQGLLSNPNWILNDAYAAKAAIQEADALLKQLES